MQKRGHAFFGGNSVFDWRERADRALGREKLLLGVFGW